MKTLLSLASPGDSTRAGIKADETRSRILTAALELFREQGFEAATMRQIAAKAGVATGAAYYYFDSKDAIVLAYYSRAQQEMAHLMREALANDKDLKERIRRILYVKFKYFEPTRGLLIALAAHTDPSHPLSPFSEQTRQIRDTDIDFFAEAVAGSRTRLAKDLSGYLPRLLWMYQMGLILFWIYDRSPGQRKTTALTEKSLHVVVRLIQMASLPLMRPVRRLLEGLVDTVAE